MIEKPSSAVALVTTKSRQFLKDTLRASDSRL